MMVIDNVMQIREEINIAKEVKNKVCSHFQRVIYFN